MGIESFLLASSLRTIISQRLVRRLCLNCCYEENATHEIAKLFNLAAGKKIYNSKGCENCTHTGYQGRIAIAECIQVDKVLKDMIHNNSSENEISNYVFKDNQSIDQASLGLLLNGVTSAEELIRVGNLKDDANL
jgi:general secretion pathway protein E